MSQLHVFIGPRAAARRAAHAQALRDEQYAVVHCADQLRRLDPVDIADITYVRPEQLNTRARTQIADIIAEIRALFPIRIGPAAL